MKCGEWTQHFVITHTLTLTHVVYVDHFTSIREISIEDKIDKIE
jgi:hypothetical protein